MMPRPFLPTPPRTRRPRIGAVRALLVGGLLALLGPSAVCAQPAGLTEIATFREAAALAIDPLGRLYVADAGRDVVQILGRTGESRATIGGAGTRAGEFDGPLALDPTNGQTLYVADAGNGRIQQFSAEQRYLGAIAVGAGGEAAAVGRRFDDGRDGADVQGTGRPVAVASSDGDATFVVESRENVVLRFDAQGRAERLTGRAGRLDAPVALALDGSRRLFVADRRAGHILAYDLFGTFVRRLPTPDLPAIRALSMHDGRLWIVSPGRVFVWNPATETGHSHPVRLDAPLIDAVPWNEQVFLLTERRLLRGPRW